MANRHEMLSGPLELFSVWIWFLDLKFYLDFRSGWVSEAAVTAAFQA